MKLSIAAFIVLAGMTLPSVGEAQVDNQFAWGVNAGAAIASRDLAKNHNTGVSAGVTFAFGGVGQFVGIRVDGIFNRFGATSDTTAGNARILAATLNLVVSVLGESRRVYLTGGVGGYGIRPNVAGQKSVNDFGLNGGLGLWLPGVSGYIEARYHHFYRALENKQPAVFVPVTVGILF